MIYFAIRLQFTEKQPDFLQHFSILFFFQIVMFQMEKSVGAVSIRYNINVCIGNNMISSALWC